MAPSARKMLRWTTVDATGCKRVGRMKWINRRILVPASMFPCAIEEKLILENVDGKEIESYETKVADKEGFTTKYPGECPQFLEDGGVVWARPRDLYAFVDRVEEEEYEEKYEEEYEVDSDLESTASSRFNPS